MATKLDRVGKSPTLRHQNSLQRRRAASNYVAVEEQAVERERVKSRALSVNGELLPEQEVRRSSVFTQLQAKFGFQDGNVRNQKEHFECWVLNYESRMAKVAPDSDEAVLLIHTKFFKNYKRWCAFLQVEPHLLEKKPARMAEVQVALFLLIWGESANLRFMPECICFLYHSLASKLDRLEDLPNVAEGTFLRRVVRPIYNVVAQMRNVQSNGKRPLDHKNITNYDDVNEFFWTANCLDFDEYNVAEAMQLQELKTFKERRSFLNPLLAFFRIYFFLIVSFHVLVAIAYVADRTDPPYRDGFKFYSKFFTEDFKEVRQQALYSIFITVAGLSAVKVVLEVWIGGLRVFQSALYAVGLFCRLVWHSVFFGLFLAVNLSPYEVLFGSSKLLSMGMPLILVYLAPVVIAAFMRMMCGRLVWNNAFLNALDGTNHQYVGRNMQQSWGSFLAYGLFWSVIFALKFLFNLQLMVKPLIGPTVEIYNIQATNEDGLIESNHNLAFLMAMWAPTFLVYIYDSQIWLVIVQSIVGAILGLRLKIGHSSRISEFVARLRAAPALFDAQVVSSAARGQLTVDNAQEHHLSGVSSSPEENSRLRFAVVWNEIVSSFRLTDLLDDRETAILQYQVSDTGAVEDPVFLLAGHAQLATDIGARSKMKKMDDRKLFKELEKAGVFGCAKNCMDLCYQILRDLLGPDDTPIIEVFNQIISSGHVQSNVNLIHLPLVRENLVDLLASVLDLPEPTVVPGGGHLQNDQIMVIIQRVDSLLKSFELMLEEEWMAEKMRSCAFTRMTPDLAYQRRQLTRIFSDRSSQDDNKKGSPASHENVISLATRLFFLLTLDAADSMPRCHEAQRRMSFFLNSLSMRMPSIKSISSMHSFSVITPYYNEPVLYSVEELNGRVSSNPLFAKVEQKDRDLSILKYLITFHSDEWGNFLERVGATSIEEALAETPTQVRLWASMRGQTLARTVQGMMLYEDALKMLRWLEIGSDNSLTHLEKIKHMDRIAGLKFSYVTSCQIYSDQLARGDPRAADIDLLMRKYPNWRVSYVDTIPAEQNNGETRYDCVLVKSDGDEIVEVYRYELPGHPLVGEGKPENQNIALPFTRGEYVQTIDMNQEHYFEEALKIPNFLATATQDGKNVSIIGMKEHIFTGRASSLARFMTQQELVFVSLTQRVLANPLRSRMHYGHPDVFEKSFVMTNGGVSKASKGINLSEDVFSGYNATLRGEHVTHEEFMQCGKGRDVTLSQINAFEAKLSNGSAESSLSREAHRMGAGLDFFRLNSMFYGHMGFYICNAITVLCVYVYAYSKLYTAFHEQIQMEAIKKTNGLDDLADVLNTQFIFQFGMLMTIPLMATLLVEYGWRQAIVNFLELIVTLGPMFYIFETGTKAHFFDVAIMRGGSKYRGTGRGFAIIRETLVNFFKEYAASHFRKAVELLGIMIIFGIYGNFSIGVDALEAYCKENNILNCDELTTEQIPDNVTLLYSYGSKGQDYGVASFAVWLLGSCWLLAPFLFNTDGLDFSKTLVDVMHWMRWMMATASEKEQESLPSNRSASSDSWMDFYLYEADLTKHMTWTSRVAYAIRELRHPLTMYYVFTFHFRLADIPLLAGAVGGVALLLWIGSGVGMMMRNKALAVRALAYMVLVLGGTFTAPLVVGSTQDWTFEKSLSLVFGIFTGLYALLQYLLILNGVMGISVAKWGLTVQLAFMFDMVVGVFVVFPLTILSALPFMRTIQTRMMYNVGFSRALSTGSEFAASLSVVVGLLGGFSYGWLTCLVYSLGYVNDATDHFINQSFNYFVNERFDGDFDREMWKVYAAGAASAACLIGTGIAHFAGRRVGILVSCAMTIGGVVLVFIESQSMVQIGVCLVSGGVAMLAIASTLYNFEICMQGWKGKGVLVFLLGASIGYMVEAIVLKEINALAMRRNWSNQPLRDWQYQFIYGASPLVLLAILIMFLPASPVWLFRHRDNRSAEAMLVKLRQKHDVADEMDDLKDAFVDKGAKISIVFRVVLVLALQATFALLSSGVMLLRVKVQPAPNLPGEQTSNWMVYFGLTSAIGVLLSMVTVDNVRRKTILKDILPFSAALAIVCGILGTLDMDGNTVMSVLLFVLYVSSALSLTSVTWLTAIEVFPPYETSRYVAISFAFYYAIQALLYLAAPSFVLSQFVFAGLCALLTVVMFLICASTKAGAIELKREKKERLSQEGSLVEEDEAISSYVARVSRSQSFLRSRVRRQSSRQQTRTPREGDYENFESPAAQTQSFRRTLNGSKMSVDGL